MNKKLTFPELAELLSEVTNTSKRMSELFLREMFAVVAQSLVDGESVKIKDLGIFKVTSVNPRKSVDVNTGNAIEIPGHNKITFSPDKRLSEAVNASFASFEAVILEDDVTAEMLGKIDGTPDVVIEETTRNEEENNTPQNVVEEMTDAENDDAEVKIEGSDSDLAEGNSLETEYTTPSKPEIAEQPEVLPIGELESEPIIPEQVENEAEQQDEDAKDIVASETSNTEIDIKKSETEETETKPSVTSVDKKENDSSADDYYYDDEDEWWGRHKTLKGFIYGTLFGVFVSVAVMYGYKYFSDNVATVPAEEYVEGSDEVVAADTMVEVADSVLEAKLKTTVTTEQDKEPVGLENPKMKAQKEVKDTITSKNVLTRMARRHYGNGHFWVYIYEENRSIIDNPNNVRPGTVVVIPDAEKYGIDKDDKESVARAKKKEGEIQSKYI